jgi:hypothetical protein
MSGGGGDKTTTSMPKWAEPYAKDYLRTSQQVAGQAYQPYGGQTVAQLNPYETQGYNAQAQRALQGSPVNQAAGSQISDTLNGKYLNNNPYLSGIIDKAGQDVNRNYDMVAARSGSFGNTGVEAMRYGALADSAMQLRGQDYTNERNRQMGALGMAPGIANQDYVDADRLTGAGAGFRGAEQRNLDDDYGRFREARDYPREQLGILGQGLGMNYGGTSSTSSKNNPWNTAIGAAATYYGAKGK